MDTETATTGEGAAPEAETGEPRGWDAGRVLDWAGGVAAVVLLVIVIDIWSDGRLISARLRRQAERPEETPGE
jgi:hypothetical protein